MNRPQCEETPYKGFVIVTNKNNGYVFIEQAGYQVSHTNQGDVDKAKRTVDRWLSLEGYSRELCNIRPGKAKGGT